jgi:hypothetical protein
MTAPVSNRLNLARTRRFIGRSAEQQILQSALAAAELPFVVLYVYGPGGVGKTSLLRQYVGLAEQTQTVPIYLDARGIDASPEAFNQALCTAMSAGPANADAAATPAQLIANSGKRHVLLIDTYELLAPLDAWLRDVFLPQSPENLLLVLAGRQAPAAGWRADPVWSELMRVVPLRNLTTDETRSYLSQRGIPAEQQQTVLDFTHGHPLALSLIADTFAQRDPASNQLFRPEDAPDVIKTLLEQFVQKVPSPAHRAALEACALARVMTEALLAIALDVPIVNELFDWLRGLSFIESNRLGVFPHDLLREALVADLRWRNPDWYAELHKRARNYYKARVMQTTGAEQQRVLFDYLFLHRDNMLVRPFFDWQESGTTLAETATSHDLPELVDMVRTHEGAESAAIAQHWFARQPHNVVVYREPGKVGDSRRISGFVFILDLSESKADDIAQDPAAEQALRYLQMHAPLRAGERATMFRFWMARESYQTVSAVQSLIGVTMNLHLLTAQRLAYNFMPAADPDFWEMVAAYGDFARTEEADFTVGGRNYGQFTHDWRITPPTAWLELLAEREIAVMSLESVKPRPQVTQLALSEKDFAQAVKNALRDLTRIEALRSSPLLRSRLLMDPQTNNANSKSQAESLRAVLVSTIDLLQNSPRDAKLYRALYHTYVQPAPTQEQAAEILDLPFSTYRRHLQSGILRIIEMLWQRELGG